jgi:hypothetical protein
MITDEDVELFKALVEMADIKFDGHLTVTKFTTNWRVSFLTPGDRDDIHDMHEGKHLVRRRGRRSAKLRTTKTKKYGALRKGRFLTILRLLSVARQTLSKQLQSVSLQAS